MAIAKTAANAALYYEAGQQLTPMSALTDSGDHTVFTSAASLWSGRSGFDADVRPNGLKTGGALTPKSGTNNSVTVAALTANLAGAAISVAGSDVTVARGSTKDYIINAVTVNASGALAVVTGTEGDSFSTTRGAAGGPPLIPVGSIEIGHVRLTSRTAGVVQASEIRATPGDTVERYDYPLFEVDYTKGRTVFASPLPTIHTGGVAKGVYASYNEPVFSEATPVSDFVPPEESHSTSSTAVYGGAIGSASSQLGQGSFTAYLASGVTDPLVALKNQTLWFKFYPDRLKGDYIRCQGKLGISRTFPAGDSMQASCTISASAAAQEVAA